MAGNKEGIVKALRALGATWITAETWETAKAMVEAANLPLRRLSLEAEPDFISIGSLNKLSTLSNPASRQNFRSILRRIVNSINIRLSSPNRRLKIEISLLEFQSSYADFSVCDAARILRVPEQSINKEPDMASPCAAYPM